MVALAFIALGAGQFAMAGDKVPPSAPPDIAGRFAVHDGFDRLVLPLPHGATVASHQDGDVLDLHVAGVGRLSVPGVAGRRARGFDGGSGQASLSLAPGARTRIWRLGDRLVIDIMAPAAKASGGVRPVSPAPARHPVTRDRAELGQPAPMPAVRSAPVVPVQQSPPEPPKPQAAPAVADPQAATPPPPAASPPQAQQSGVAVTLLPDQASPCGPAILIPLPKDAGAAAFRRGGNSQSAQGHVVFDVAQPLDLSQMKDDPVFGSLTERLLPDGMRLAMQLPPESRLCLARRPEGWVLAEARGPSAMPRAPAGIVAHAQGGKLLFAAAAPGRVVVLDDETTGGRLLVGTQRGEGQAMTAPHTTAEFGVPPTWLGVVVVPVSDRLQLRTTQSGFELKAADGGPLDLLWPDAPPGSLPAARAMTRVFDLPALPPAELHNRLGQALADAALTPKLARFAPRLRVAQAMLAQGMDREAGGVLQAAIADDPAHRDDPVVQGLQAVVAWLSARAGGQGAPAPDFDPSRLGGSDEARLWRALLAPGPDAAATASNLSTVWPLLADYPPNLRRLMLPSVADALDAGRQDTALAALLAAFPDASLDLARARLLQRQGKLEASLALYDRIAAGRDRLARADALQAAVEARLAAHRLTAAAAADLLANQYYAWRDPARELRLRLRVAALRAQSGAWRQALDLLRETGTVFPDSAAQIHAAEESVIAGLLRGDSAARLSAFDLVALADEASKLLSAADADTTLAPILVDKLLALDLPERAEPILRRLFDQAPSAGAKAALGLRLAGLLADRGDTKAALDVLGKQDDAVLDPALALPRGLLRASLLVRAGEADTALLLLAGLPGREAVDQRAAILEGRKDWPSAVAALQDFLAGDAFSALPDRDQREMILHLARDASEAGDMAALRRLRESQGSRFASGPGADLFAVLTADPIQAVSDLPRSEKELATMRVLPGDLAARHGRR